MQTFRDDPDNPHQRTNAIAQVRTPQVWPSSPAREKNFYFRGQRKYIAGSLRLKITRPLADAALLACLGAAHTSLLKAFANILDPSSAGPSCPLCKAEPQTIEHWQRRCPRLNATRQNIFGSPSLPLKVVTTDPEWAPTLERATIG